MRILSNSDDFKRIRYACDVFCAGCCAFAMETQLFIFVAVDVVINDVEDLIGSSEPDTHDWSRNLRSWVFNASPKPVKVTIA